jgi:D-glycero-alpha-D-manno-heptose-7-phosphate kinase
MIISRTPYRISFFGGGTDYPVWSQKEGGAVLSTTIDKYCYISARYLPPFFATRHRIVWSHIETIGAISEILHPAVKAGLRYLGFDDSKGLEIHHQGDLPARSGIGSSSSFSVGLIRALLALQGRDIAKHDLALKAIELEQTVMKETVGSQDQVAAAYGGFNVIHFRPGGEIQVVPVRASSSRLAELERHLLLFFTGTSRMSSDIATAVVGSLKERERELREMRAMVERGERILEGAEDIQAFGRLVHDSWMLKRDLNPKVSSPAIDRIYETAREHGALGGKLLGAGSSGFMVLFVPPERQPSVIQALSSYLHVPFRFETEGCRLIYRDSTPEAVRM